MAPPDQTLLLCFELIRTNALCWIAKILIYVFAVFFNASVCTKSIALQI